MNHPDETLPEIQLSLRAFVTTAQELYLREGASYDFVRFVLAGRIPIGDGQARVFVNARQGVTAPPPDKCQLQSDVDSAIGISYDLPFKVPLAVFPVAPFRDTLTNDIHVSYDVNLRKIVSYDMLF
jgi:hypothetical protein